MCRVGACLLAASASPYLPPALRTAAGHRSAASVAAAGEVMIILVAALMLGGLAWVWWRTAGNGARARAVDMTPRSPGRPTGGRTVPAGELPDGRIVVSGLTKHYQGVRAVDSLSFVVEPGRVTGFLGPNGAGKTTTLRMLLNLVQPTAGTATIGGVRYADLDQPVRRVGAVLEASGAHKGRTGRNHLRIICAAAGLPASRADEVLELVGLTPAAKRKFRGYSLGMRQRLGIASAMLGNPRVL